MAKVKYNLFDGNATDETYIFLIFRYNNIRLKYSTGLKIHPKFWNYETQRAKETVKFNQYPEFNTFLNNLADEVRNFYRSFVVKHQYPSLDEFKAHLDSYLQLKPTLMDVPKKKTLFQFIEQLIEEKEGQPRGTTKIFKTFFNHLKNYAQEQGKKQLDFKDITIDFSQSFIKYLYAEPRSHSTNYAAKMLETLRYIMKDAKERDYNQNLAFENKRFRIAKEEVQKIYLTQEELKTMYEFDFSGDERLERVRDLFIIGCYTGLRFSDFTSIKPEHIKNTEGVDIIQLTTQKTGEPVSIPLHPYVRAILTKYQNRIPRPLSNQKMNDYIKEVAEKVGITSIEAIVKSRGGKRIDETSPKHELVSTHTARRSFATNAYKMGVPSIAIMKITGHRTERQFMSYIKIGKEENAVSIANNPFFKSVN